MSLNPELKALLDSESELMRLFREKAPGTLRHCESVAHLTDAVCVNVASLDRDILFPAAKLHDIGKIINPLYLQGLHLML